MSEAAPLTSTTSPDPVAAVPVPTETTTIFAERIVPAGGDQGSAVADAAGVILVAVVALAAAGVAIVLWAQSRGRRWLCVRVVRALQDARWQGYGASLSDQQSGGRHLRLIRPEDQ